MSRHPGKVEKFANAEVVEGDFADPDSLRTAFSGVQTALVISGSAPPGERAELHRSAFEAAKLAGVAHVVYLSLQGASATSKYPYSRDHCVSEEYLAATGLRHTILRDAFYMEMFIDLFDSDGVIRGPASDGRGAFVSRDCVARTAAAVLLTPAGGVHDVTGPEALSVGDVARRLSPMVGRHLQYEPEAPAAARTRLKSKGMPEHKIDLQVGWFEAIAAGELARPSDTVRRFTGNVPLSLEANFTSFPELLNPLR